MIIFHKSILDILSFLGPLFNLIVLGFIILNIIGYWKLYEKTGRKGWESLIPFYRTSILFEMAGLNVLWFYIYLIASIMGRIYGGNILWLSSFVCSFTYFNAYFNLSKKFNKKFWFTIGLTFFSYIFIPILGLFKNNRYNSGAYVSENGIFK